MTALVHGEDWSVGIKYFAVYWLKFYGGNDLLHSPMFENTDQHAEDNLLRHLRLQLSVINMDRLESLTIMQSSSPCHT
nr:hypothetical protein BaRGS_003632 [Batillaria attramentaria]